MKVKKIKTAIAKNTAKSEKAHNNIAKAKAKKTNMYAPIEGITKYNNSEFDADAIKDVKHAAFKDGANEIIQMYVSFDDEYAAAGEVALLTKMIMNEDDPADFDYIVLKYTFKLNQIRDNYFYNFKLVYSSDDSDSDIGSSITPQNLGYYQNFEFVRDRILKNTLNDNGKMFEDWQFIA